MNGWLIFLLILNGYILAVYLLARGGILKRYNVGLMGPALMFRTQRGKKLIEKISRAKRFWIWSGTFGIWLTLASMFLLTLLLIVQLPMLFRIPEAAAPGAREILALPGINPLIPIGYGIVALILAIVIHEFSHGILARAQNLKVKSLGMLYFIVPIGAFVEPDEEELTAAPRKERMRVFAAGPTSNIVTTVICGLLFSMVFIGGAEPVEDGFGVLSVVEGSPADRIGLEAFDKIVAINGTDVTSNAAFTAIMGRTNPGQEVEIVTARGGPQSTCLAHIEMFNGTTPDADTDFCTLRNDTSLQNETGFLGIGPFDPHAMQQQLVAPFSAWEDDFGGCMSRTFGGDMGCFRGILLYIALPFLGLSPINEPLTDFYTTPWASDTAYWMTANVLYWLMWISLMLGLTNALPAVPLDGGYLFRDFVEDIVQKVKPTVEAAKRAAIAKKASVYTSFLILGLILMQFIAPRVGKYFI